MCECCPSFYFLELHANAKEQEGIVEAREEEEHGHFTSQGKPPFHAYP
jgi:hypothetical protein